MKVAEPSADHPRSPVFLCDYSPPRHSRLDTAPAPPSGADFISVAYNPGHSVRVNPVIMAAHLQRRYRTPAVFTLATRDMNRLALQSLLLGAQALDLRNVIVVAGDPFPTSGPAAAAVAVNDYRPTQLIAAISNLNAGVDYRGRPMPLPTDFCIGATVDLARGIEREARLTVRKIRAGAHFLITQPIYDPDDAPRFAAGCTAVNGGALSAPICYGVALPDPDGLSFAPIPGWVHRDLTAGRSPLSIALQIWNGLRSAGARCCYLVPPIRRNGARDYRAAEAFLRRAAR